jgi:glutamine cyclotransferase
MKKLLFILLTAGLLNACTNATKGPEKEAIVSKPDASIPEIYYSIESSTPHDTTSFTEGLFIHNNQLFESTGSPDNLPQTKSVFGIVDLKTGKIDVKAELNKDTYFGEGIILIKDKIYQLTYKNQIGFIYDAKTFKKTGQFTYQNKEGWGLTTDGASIIMSDGTDKLTYLDPTTLKVSKTLVVSNNGYAEDYLNELEYIKGYIYANVWTKNYIVKIDPGNGKVMGILNLSALYSQAKNRYRHALEMNGIAFDSINDKIYITGKLWADIYQIKFPH